MNPHLKSIPRLTSLTTRRLAGRNLQALRRQSHWSLDAEILRLRALDELLADLFQRLHFARGQGDTDFVDFLLDGVALVDAGLDTNVQGPRAAFLWKVVLV